MDAYPDLIRAALAEFWRAAGADARRLGVE